MSEVKVIIQGSSGIFEPAKEFEQLIKQQGYESVFEIEARTDHVLINYVEEQARNNHGVLRGKEDYLHVLVVEVDTSVPWMISKYDGAESIRYLEYEVIDEYLNYVRLK